MKNIMNAALILAILSTLGYSGYQYSLTPCDKVLEYSIGRFDTNFGLSKEQFKTDISMAEVPWEKALNKNLFEYNPNAEFTVNLIYDERQKETINKQKTESGLNAAESFFKNLDAKFEAMKADYDAKTASYEAAKSAYEAKVASYEAEVSYYNSQKGAPPAKYRQLEAQRVALNASASSLNAKATELNNLSQSLNAIVGERNNAAERYNDAVESYNRKYGGHFEFNQAEYDGKEINVYQFGNSKSLVAALAHELGHSLSMDHVENKDSIMYYLRESDNISSVLTPSAEDMVELKKVCRL